VDGDELPSAYGGCVHCPLNLAIIALPVGVGLGAYVRTGRRPFLLIVFALALWPLIWGFVLVGLSMAGVDARGETVQGIAAPFFARVFPVALVTLALWQLTGQRAR
jgi:hypothetical protein